jgi:hypothetical protein
VVQKQPQQVAWSDPEMIGEIGDEAFSRNPSSISRMPRATVVAVPFHAGLPGAASGLHRKHGRKPARSAAAAVAKN